MVTPVHQRRKLSAEEFDAFVLENTDKLYELINGEVFEVPSNPYVSMIAGLILTALNIYLRSNPNAKGHVTGEAGGYMVSGERYAPDVAYISYERQPELARKGYNPNPPELAVEVISDTSNFEEQQQLRMKITGYHAAGVLVWVVNPDEQVVEVHQVGKAAYIVDKDGKLTCSDILPKFELPVKDIFPQKDEA